MTSSAAAPSQLGNSKATAESNLTNVPFLGLGGDGGHHHHHHHHHNHLHITTKDTGGVVVVDSNAGTVEPRLGDRVNPANHSEPQKPRVLIMGLRRSGKSSIQKVVFHKMSPNETLFLESSSKIVRDDIRSSSFVFFSIYNLPGQLDLFDLQFDVDELLRTCDALVFVIDAQDEYSEALARLHETVLRALKLNPSVRFEVFVHKVDCLSDENKMEVQRDIQQRVDDDLIDAGYDGIYINFHLTSIYDHSIFEAFSKVVQKLIPQMATLENMLDVFISNCGIDKAFLFDVVSKIYVATDSSPVDMQTYELCCDMIDVVMDMSGIYGSKDDDSDANVFDCDSASIIKLNNQTVLYLRQVNAFLALVCILREENFDRQGIIDYNFHCFKDAIQDIFEVKSTRAPSTQPQTLASTTTNGSIIQRTPLNSNSYSIGESPFDRF